MVSTHLSMVITDKLEDLSLVLGGFLLSLTLFA
jgi:hypothetical protein